MAKNKKFALVNSYFKNRGHDMPETILQIANYWKDNEGQLPFEYNGDNWVYDAFVERQKRSGVHCQQFLTPDVTADIIAGLALMYAPDDMSVVDACCGTGQLSRSLLKAGFKVEGFDYDNDLIKTCKMVYPDTSFYVADIREKDLDKKRPLIVSNPPYDLLDMQVFLIWLDRNLADNGTAILLIPKGFLNKERPKTLVSAIKKFEVIHSEDMAEEFARTNIRAEIVVLEKAEQTVSGSNGAIAKGIKALLSDKPQPQEVQVEIKDQTGNSMGSLNKSIVEKFMKSSDKGGQPMFDNILLQDIVIDPNQPRQYFNETDMDELIDSIRENGVLQPILLRPTSDKKYMIVCGERRWRASSAVAIAFKQRNTIPAIIREMTDAEALEAQIIENLQRKDVRPMEEAVAFKSLLDHKQMDIREIAAKIGKTPQFVAFRIHLNDLIADFQEMLNRGVLTITDANKLCKVSSDVQEMILAEETEGIEDWRNEDDFELFNIDFYLDKNKVELSKAKFDTDDQTLYPEAGACSGCQYNSSNAPLLFGEEVSVCNRSACFQIKISRAYNRKVEDVLLDPNIIPIMVNVWPSDDDKLKAKAFTERGATVLPHDKFQKVTAADKKTDRYKEAKSEGRVRKAFVVCGTGEGSIVDVIVSKEINESGENSISNSNAEQISKIKAREVRAKELDGEKIQKRIAEDVKKADIKVSSTNSIEVSESILRFLLWEKIGWYLQRNVFEVLDRKEVNIADTKDLQTFLMSLTKAELYKLCHMALQNQYSNHVSYKGDGSYFIRLFASAIGIPVDAYAQEQEEKAEKRQQRVNERIAALQEVEPVEA